MSSVFSTILLLSILAILFASCMMRLVVQWSLHFIAFGFFCKAVILTSLKSLGYWSVSFMLLIRCAISLRSSSPSNLSTSPGTSSSYYIHIKQILSSSFSSYILKIIFHTDIQNGIGYTNKLLMPFKSCFTFFVTGYFKVFGKAMNFQNLFTYITYISKFNVQILMRVCSVM